MDEARAVAAKTGVPLVEHAEAGVTSSPAAKEKVGFGAPASRQHFLPTFFLGLMSFCGLLLTYGLNTWLPGIMGQNGYGKNYSLLFVLLLNLGAIVGAMSASYLADRTGPKWVICSTFLMAAALVLLPFGFPTAMLFLLVAVTGIGTIGTQVLVYGFVSNFYESRARGAWCAGFGRLGGIVGPLVGGCLFGAGIAISQAFQLFAIAAAFGAIVTLLPRAAKPWEQVVVVEDPAETVRLASKMDA